MTTDKNTGAESKSSFISRYPVLATALFLGLALAFLFHKSFDPQYVHFSNDGRLGVCVAQESHMPDQIFGAWSDLNWLGTEGLSAMPSYTSLLRWFGGPFWYSRMLPPAALIFAGLSACFCFRKLKFAPITCILGGLAAGLNSDFFSTACWGVASQTVGFGAMFIAVGLMNDPGKSFRQWIIVIVAGMAVGLGIMEAYDIGALFSLFVAAFIMYRALFIDRGETPVKIGKGIAQVTIVAVFAALVAAYALSGLIGTAVVGVAATGQDKDTKEKIWPFATQFSLPKKEVLQVFIPGVFGYRNPWHMYDDGQPKADQYWGTIGVDPNVDMLKEMQKSSNPEQRAQADAYLKRALWRLSGTGYYDGILVILLALWAAFQSLHKVGSPYSDHDRLAARFWFGVLIVALLLAFGRYAPFFRLFYSLPYASAIRNPAKFMHIFSFAMIMLFGYGVQGLYLTYMKTPAENKGGWLAQIKAWRAKATGFDRSWLNGCFAVIGISFVAWLIYASKTRELQEYIESVAVSPDESKAVAMFSVWSVGWYILLLCLGTVLLATIFSGRFSGSRARWGGILMGALLVFDLGRAGMPWIFYWDVTYKYAADPIIKLLAEHPYEQRVSIIPPSVDSQQIAVLGSAYGSNWKQHLFPYHNIECVDVVQEPRVSEDKQKFESGLPTGNLLRWWALSNTKYLLGPGPGMKFLEQVDPQGKKFKIIQGFDFVPKISAPLTAVDFAAQPNTNGQLAVMEYLDALPRASLFSNWQISTNDDATIHQLGAPEFDPKKIVLVSDASAPVANAANVTNAAPSAGTVTINPNYKPKRIQIAADVQTPSVLLLTDRYSPKWQVEVDGKPAPLLRCNYIMRGVYLTPGKHEVVFRFVSSFGTLYVSLAAIALGLAFSCFLGMTRRKE